MSEPSGELHGHGAELNEQFGLSDLRLKLDTGISLRNGIVRLGSRAQYNPGDFADSYLHQRLSAGGSSLDLPSCLRSESYLELSSQSYLIHLTQAAAREFIPSVLATAPATRFVLTFSSTMNFCVH